MQVTPVPGAPQQVRGLMNLRGKVVTVIDLAVCLGHTPRQTIDDCQLLILKTNEEIGGMQNMENCNLGFDLVGFVINRMGDVISIEEEEILPKPANLDVVEEALIAGVINRNEQLVIVLEVPAVLARVMNECDEATT